MSNINTCRNDPELRMPTANLGQDGPMRVTPFTLPNRGIRNTPTLVPRSAVNSAYWSELLMDPTYGVPHPEWKGNSVSGMKFTANWTGHNDFVPPRAPWSPDTVLRPAPLPKARPPAGESGYTRNLVGRYLERSALERGFAGTYGY